MFNDLELPDLTYCSTTANPSAAESETAKSKQKQYFTKRDATKVYLLCTFDRWKAVKEENRLGCEQINKLRKRYIIYTPILSQGTPIKKCGKDITVNDDA